jgi:para-nitrobenzyl esterase
MPRQLTTALLLCVMSTAALHAQAAPQARTANGRVQGLALASGIARFTGIPFAAAPVGALRWKPPQAALTWNGTRDAAHFADQCMQGRPFSDMVFRNSGTSEDCLYLNVWTASPTASPRMPVLVYIYGGGFVAGDGSEPRYDGEAMARRGVVVVTLSHRLGIFGFFSHPELASESPKHASGNYGLMDQTAALRWVKANIAAFGGDPARVTIAGESAGSFSVSAQMASPSALGLFAGAIGESGAFLGATLAAKPAAATELDGTAFGVRIGATTLARLRALSAFELLDASGRTGMPRFSASIDGDFMPESPTAIYAQGKQSRVPLLAGWNSEEGRGQYLVPTLTSAAFDSALQKTFGTHAAAARIAYGGTTTTEIAQSATDIVSDQFIGYGTWKWLEEQSRVAPVYRYYFTRARPPLTTPAPANNAPASVWDAIPHGAPHSTEIEYALGNLPGNPVYAWTADDQLASATTMTYFVNFIKTGDPNGAGVPAWPSGKADASGRVMRMRLDAASFSEAEPRARYLFLQGLSDRR